jgi:hypothetical protein
MLNFIRLHIPTDLAKTKEERIEANPHTRLRLPRDMQRKKLYAAERDVFYGTEHAEKIPIVKCRALMKRIWKRQDFRRAFPKSANSLMLPTCVEKRSGCSLGGWHGIKLAPDGRCKWITVHELAHTVCYRELGPKDGHGHGRHYAATYLRLVRMVFGDAWERKLKASFKKHGVKYKARRVMSPEAKAALRERLTLAREAKAALNK